MSEGLIKSFDYTSMLEIESGMEFEHELLNELCPITFNRADGPHRVEPAVRALSTDLRSTVSRAESHCALVPRTATPESVLRHASPIYMYARPPSRVPA